MLRSGVVGGDLFRGRGQHRPRRRDHAIRCFRRVPEGEREERHGLLWIGMSIASILAVHYRVINLRLALAITLLGCIAPFFGTIEFLLQSHRRKLAEADAEAVAS